MVHRLHDAKYRIQNKKQKSKNIMHKKPDVRYNSEKLLHAKLSNHALLWNVRDKQNKQSNPIKKVILRRGQRISKFLLPPSFLALGILTIIFVAISPAFAAKTVSSTELIEKCRFYNGKQVLFQGEVIGDVMIRGKNAWINVNDDVYAEDANVEEDAGLKGYNSGQSIWCRASQVGFIEHKGDYQNSGDIVRIEGTFNRACPEHRGDMDIHARSVALVKTGHPISHPFNFQRAFVAVVLAALTVLLFIANWLLSRKESKSNLSRQPSDS